MAPPTEAAPPNSGAAARGAAPLVEARGVFKQYPGVLALSDVSIAIQPGRVHVIAGENGAGKSTLVKILTGTEQPSQGDVLILGQSARGDPTLFKRIGYVPQELSLFPHLSVAENLFIPFEETGHYRALIRSGGMRAAAQSQLERFKIRGSPDQQVRELSISDQQLLMIARACSHRNLDVLILDEPTSSLTVSEIERLFDIVRQLRGEGKGIVFISHKSEEVFAIADELTILRNGALVGHFAVGELDERRLLSQMAGREVAVGESFLSSKPLGGSVLEVSHLTGPGFSDISFTLRHGEVLGFAGLVGSGRSEIMQSIFGYRAAKSGEVVLDGKPVKPHDTTAAVAAGVLYLSEERKHHGVFAMQSLLHNIGAMLFDRTAPRGMISRSRERRLVQDIVDRFEVKAPSLSQRVLFLSGGNQQKAIIGRALAQKPEVLILDEPTRGIDVRTKVEIYGIIRHLAEQGIGVIMVSSDMLELRKCCARIICLYQGQITGEFDGHSCTNEELVAAIFGQARGQS